MFHSKRKTFAAAIAFVTIASICAVCGCSTSGASGGTPVIIPDPQYRITKVTVTGLMDADTNSRIPAIDFLYQDDADKKEKLDVTDWSSIFYNRQTGTYNHYSCWLRSCEWNLEYDADGNLVSKAWSDDFGEAGEYKYTYDSNGNELTEQYVKFIPDETVIDERTREYNDSGVMVREEQRIYVTPTMWRSSVSYDQEDTRVTSIFDDYGNLTKKTVDSDMLPETAEASHYYEYDERGNVLVDKTIVGETVLETTTYTYDSNDERLSKYTVPGEGPKEDVDFYKRDEYEWTRTADGKPLTLRSHDAGYNWGETSWDYDDSGRLLAKTRIDGSVTTETKYVYDEAGRETEMTETTGEGVVTHSRVTEYSSDGTATMKAVKRSKDGEVRIEYSCTFDENGCPKVFSAVSPSDKQSIEISFEYERV